MKDRSDIPARPAPAPNDMLLSKGSDIVKPLRNALLGARNSVAMLAEEASPELKSKLIEIQHRIEGFEPSVAMIGQVGTGKTALTNVMAGQIGLLPSDFNPRTSVVTTLHLNARRPHDGVEAEFRFFDAAEWESLETGGGCPGAFPGRAGADDEIKALLGETHRFDYCDRDLIECYTCPGAPDGSGDDPGCKQGRFAEITKSADLYLEVPHLGSTLCLRDKPGGDDSTKMRDRIALQALQECDLCVVVLSAHAALNAADQTLIQLISTFEKRQVILFVNRIDELENPGEKIPEIRDSILDTLNQIGVSEDAALVFGSAKWAELALAGDLSDQPKDDKKVLLDMADAAGIDLFEDPVSFIWTLSGVPELMSEINTRIVEGSGRRFIDDLRASLKTLSGRRQAGRETAEATRGPGGPGDKDGEHLAARLSPADSKRTRGVDGAFGKLLGGFRLRLKEPREAGDDVSSDEAVIRQDVMLAANGADAEREEPAVPVDDEPLRPEGGAPVAEEVAPVGIDADDDAAVMLAMIGEDDDEDEAEKRVQLAREDRMSMFRELELAIMSQFEDLEHDDGAERALPALSTGSGRPDNDEVPQEGESELGLIKTIWTRMGEEFDLTRTPSLARAVTDLIDVLETGRTPGTIAPQVEHSQE
ncbi:hypothetical protein DDZ14_18135 [Maritimibacter sp. 55A14]|uniref:GTP-binding protein n=1 Tax=Maritimibacter sp. 55A14 TaxID=2174844 RepID=UPI000D607652|nr:GTP-binding protein [Maritimibacter sp. 55A14]PWE28903.1 hypothetical protein DDZ14_18135 [Maritimibacter sp. 55A14]